MNKNKNRKKKRQIKRKLKRNVRKRDRMVPCVTCSRAAAQNKYNEIYA